MRGPLDGLRVLVTGAGSGIGRALAIEASRRGARVCLCGRREHALAETLKKLSVNQDHAIVVADLTVNRDRLELSSYLSAEWGALDVLVNNAGLIEAGKLETTSCESVDRMLSINVAAPIHLTRELLPLLLMGRYARVVNVGSMLGEIPFPSFAAYSASKAAIKGFSTAMRRELIAKGIAVTYVAPRSTDTEGAAAALATVAAGRVDEPGVVANRIWNGVQRGKSQIYPSASELMFMALQAMVPGLVDRAVTPRSKFKLAQSSEDNMKEEATHARL